MTKLLVVPHKRDDLSCEEFGRYWREVRRPVPMDLPACQNCAGTSRITGMTVVSEARTWSDVAAD
jgi:hypothetical protein